VPKCRLVGTAASSSRCSAVWRRRGRLRRARKNALCQESDYLSTVSADGFDVRTRAFREGLRHEGYIEGDKSSLNSVGGKQPRTFTRVSKRAGPAPGVRSSREWRNCGTNGSAGDRDDYSDRVWDCGRSRTAWPGSQPCPSWRQHDRREFVCRGAWQSDSDSCTRCCRQQSASRCS
jgi:hypothetical protein